MKQLSIVYLISIIILVGCSQKVNTIEQVLSKEVPHDINKIICKVEVTDDIVMLLYTINDIFENDNNVNDILNVALFKKSKVLGWNFLGDKDWVFANNDIMEIYDDTIHYEENGDLKDISIIYGYIINPQIVRVEVGNEEMDYSNAKIIEKDGIKYFYHIYHATREDKGSDSKSKVKNIGTRKLMAKGISENGEVLIHQGGN